MPPQILLVPRPHQSASFRNRPDHKMRLLRSLWSLSITYETKYVTWQPTHASPHTPSSSLPGFGKLPGLPSSLHPDCAFTHRRTRMPSPVPPFHLVFSAPSQGELWICSSNLLIQNYQPFIWRTPNALDLHFFHSTYQVSVCQILRIALWVMGSIFVSFSISCALPYYTFINTCLLV